MEVSWLKYSPAENVTALVVTPLPEFQRASTGAAIMLTDPEVERVAFLCPTQWGESAVRVEMAGGEFCAAGLLCGAVYSAANVLQPGMSMLFPVEGDNVSDFVTCLLHMESGHCEAAIDMPLPGGVDTVVLSFGGKNYQMPVVRFGGVTHAILPADAMDHAMAEEAVREWCRIEKAEAMGLIFYNSITSYIEPLVYVPAANTLCWERSCADGCAALGAFLATLAKADLVTDVRQPGGVIKVRADWRGGRLSRLSVSTKVEFLGNYSVVI